MARYRSTKLTLYTNRCPHAVQQYEDGAQWDRTIFATGVAAHDFLHAMGEFPHTDRETVCRSVAARLIATGREGHDSEGPLAPDAVYAGRDLVLEWINWGGDPSPVPGLFEPGFGFYMGDELPWRMTSYALGDFGIHPDAVYPIRTSEGRGLVVRDYKTSWQAGAATVNTLQLRAQAVAVWMWSQTDKYPADWPAPDFIRREVVSIRMRETFHEDTWLDAEGVHALRQWAGDISQTIKAMDTGDRSPRVGRHCLTCPFQQHCDAWTKVNPVGVEKDGAQVLADDYIMTLANSKRLEALCREVSQDGPIELTGGTVVGTVGKASTKVDVGKAAAAIVREWFDDLDPGLQSQVIGMLIAMKPGVTQLRNVAKVIYQGADKKVKRAQFVDGCTFEKVSRKFGVFNKTEVK